VQGALTEAPDADATRALAKLAARLLDAGRHAVEARFAQRYHGREEVTAYAGPAGSLEAQP